MNETNRNFWVDYLRSTLTVLVVAHHSALAYTSFAHFDKAAYINGTHAVVDGRKWAALDVFVNFNDIFFMSLMFLIGGLFLPGSIDRKGELTFLKDRLLRLLLPFMLLGTLLMLLAYYPSFLISAPWAGVMAYVADFFTTEQWPVGPPWFIWVLFVFNVLFMASDGLFRRYRPGIGLVFAYFGKNPFLFLSLLFLLGWVLFVPLAYKVGASTWTGIGPFDFQLGRPLLYFGYFIIGCLIGYTDFNQGLLSMESLVVRRWRLWIILAMAIFIGLTFMTQNEILLHWVRDGLISEFCAWMIYFSIYTLCCTLSCIAVLVLFRKFATSRQKYFDSLSANAYLIYLLHFVFVTWLQYILLPFDLPAILKFFLTFIFSVAASWSLAICLKKSALVRKYL